MAKNKLSIDFNGVDQYLDKLKAMGEEAPKRAAESALKASQAYIAKSASQAIQPHRETGQTAGTVIKSAPVEWTGDTAAIPIGFDIAGGGLASIFLMYGTKVHGQPHEAPDRNLYNSIYGAAVRKQVRKLQEEAFKKVIERVMKS